MKEFITEIETETGSFICSDYPFKKETGKRKIKTVRYYGRRDAPDIICCLKNCGGAQSELKVSLENNTANALVINKIKSAKIFEDGDGLLGDLQPDIWLFRQGTSSPGDEVKFIPVFKRSKVPDTSTIEKDWYKEFKYYKEIFSETFAVFQNLKTKKTLLLGFVSLADQQTRINVVVRGDLLMLEAVANTGGYLLSPGEKLSAEVLQIATGTDANKLIRNYIDTVTAKMKPKFSRKVPAGWSSWQYYRRNVTEADVLENIKALKDDKYPIEYILLDDGFQKNNAEWHKTNKKFPHGLKWLSGKIQAAGYKPGLWIAPLTILENTEIFKKHKDWLMKDKEGRLLKKFSHMGNVYALDFTMPGACKWLARLMRTLVKDYGFKYIKLDGPILRYYVGGVFSEKNITPVQAIRKALQIIRKNSKGALIEGEGYYGPSIGLVDVQRTSQDIQTEWAYMKSNIQVALMSNYLHKKWWVNNPDAFILRDTSTEHHYDPANKEHTLTKNEIEVQITAHVISGGEVMLTDRMAILKEERKKLASVFLPPWTEAAEPVDIFNGEACPSIFKLQKKKAGWLAVFNWSEKEKFYRFKEFGLKKKKYRITDFWSGKNIDAKSKLCVKHHSVRFLTCK